MASEDAIMLTPSFKMYINSINSVVSHTIDIMMHNEVMCTCKYGLNITGTDNQFWRLAHVEQEQLTVPENLNPSLVFSEVRVVRSLVFYVVFCKSLFVLFFLLLVIVLSVFLRFTVSDCTFGIFKPFLTQHLIIDKINEWSQFVL